MDEMIFEDNVNMDRLVKIWDKKRRSKEDKAFLRRYFKDITKVLGKDEHDEKDKIFLSILEGRLNSLLNKDKHSKIELEELRALYSNAKWHVIRTWSKVQAKEVEEELKKTKIRGFDLYRAPYKWSFYWP